MFSGAAVSSAAALTSSSTSFCKKGKRKKMAYDKVTALMAQVKWSEISAAIEKDGRVRLADYAEKYNVSIPTMRKMMEKKYGTTIQFRRGRTGGVFPTPGNWVSNTSTKKVESAVESVNYVPDAPVEVSAVDAETESQVDRILGVGA